MAFGSGTYGAGVYGVGSSLLEAEGSGFVASSSWSSASGLKVAEHHASALFTVGWTFGSAARIFQGSAGFYTVGFLPGSAYKLVAGGGSAEGAGFLAGSAQRLSEGEGEAWSVGFLISSSDALPESFPVAIKIHVLRDKVTIFPLSERIIFASLDAITKDG